MSCSARRLLLLLITTLITDVSAAEQNILDLDLTELMKITTAGRKKQDIADVPAAAYVIRQEDIKNSGVTSLAEALRMVPGISVARISSSKWAISSRGFNGTFGNKLLVQIDGRSVYTPAYSGVYWDMQNVVLEDIDRIEVIRGPGATLWGANAVNGIINILTKHAADTQTTLVSGATGSHDKLMATFRTGKQLSNNTYGRVYIDRHDQDSYEFQDDSGDASDDWQMTSSGFRVDGDHSLQDSWTLQGDIYHGENNQRIDTYVTEADPYVSEVKDTLDSTGLNLLARWQQDNPEKGGWAVQSYYDYTYRNEIVLEQTIQKFDIDFQYRFKPTKQQDFMWGVGYRFTNEKYVNTYQIAITPEKSTDHLISAFLQDEISFFDEQLKLTIGSKLEHFEEEGFEVQPNLRALWKVQQNHSLWAAYSYAVRSPSSIEKNSEITLYYTPYTGKVTMHGNDDLKPERLSAYEAGYRYIPSNHFSTSVDLFYNKYKDLIGYNSDDSTGDYYFDNAMQGETYGIELSSAWQANNWLKMDLIYSYIHIKIDDDVSIITSVSAEAVEGSTPQHQISLRNNFKLSKRSQLNVWLRRVGKLSTASASSDDSEVDAYFEMDVNINWQLTSELQLTLAGQNLLHASHLEFIQESFTSPIDIERSVYAKLAWEF